MSAGTTRGRESQGRHLHDLTTGISVRTVQQTGSSAGLVVGASPAGGTALPPEDLKALEMYLGHGVVGDAVADRAIDDPVKFCSLHSSTSEYSVTAGKDRGKTQEWVVDHPDGQPDSVWRATHTDDWVMFLQAADDGGVHLTSEIDYHGGVISRYSPGIPLLWKGMKPGEIQHRSIAVKVFDVNHPDHQEHSGSLDLTVTYLGNHEVRVPNGTYEAAVVKYAFKGKVGPATVEDTLYRCFVEDVGVVARIEVKNISALFLYNDDSKMGMVLTGKN